MIIGKYKNGNYNVILHDDGTKVRFNNLDNLTPEFAESIDVKITDKCSIGCPFCYEGCSEHGKHSDIMSQEWIHTLHPYTEIAINGNDMDHPQLGEFLSYAKRKNIIVNITVNQLQLMKYYDVIKKLCNENLIHGVGISVSVAFGPGVTDKIQSIENFVVHLINGVADEDFFKWNKNTLSTMKVLVLGYKRVGKGVVYLEEHEQVKKNMDWLKDNIIDMIKNKSFDVVSFDNLAIEQLELERQIRENPELGFDWESLYMGDDGQYSFYIDTVNKTFSKNSTVSKDVRYPINEMSVDEMFNFIRDTK